LKRVDAVYASIAGMMVASSLGLFGFSLAGSRGNGYCKHHACTTSTTTTAPIPSTTAPTTTAPPPPAGSRIFNLVQSNYSNVLQNPDFSVLTQRYTVIDLMGFNGPRLCAGIIAGNSLCLIYKNPLQIGYGTDTYPGSSLYAVYGVSPAEADPSWELNLSWNHGIMADMGNPGYQQKFVQNVIAAAQAGGFNGIFLDDLHWRQWTGYPSKYPDQASWDAAMESFLAYVGPALKAAGLTVIINVGPSPSADGFKPLIQQWLSYVDGLMDEGVGRANVSHTGPLDTGVWITNRMAVIETCQQMGKIFYGSIPADDTDTQAIAYGIAELLLSDDSSNELATVSVAGSAEADGSHFGHEVWTSVNDQAVALGPALEPVQGSITAGYYRHFQNGEVRLNPTSGTLTIDGVSMAPTTGLIT
jgi:hypothetical protein